MATHKTAELEGALLDAAVAKAIGDPAVRTSWGGRPCQPYVEGGIGQPGSNITAFEPSVNWSQGGPIIERERISTVWTVDVVSSVWAAETLLPQRVFGLGPTPLIAAMRAYVASKLGDVVDLP